MGLVNVIHFLILIEIFGNSTIFSPPLCYSLNFTKKLQNERKEDFLHIWLLQRITLYERGQKITSVGTIEFLDTHVCLNNPHLQSSGIIIFLSEYYIGISGKLVGSFLNVLFLLLPVILSELHEKPRRKDLVTANSTQKNLCEIHHFFDFTPSFLFHFLLLSSSTPSPFRSGVLA